MSHLRGASPSNVRRCSQSIAVCSRGWFSLNQQLFYVQVIPAIDVDASERMQSQPFYLLHPQTRNGTGIRFIRELYIGDHMLAKAQLCTAPNSSDSAPAPLPGGMEMVMVIRAPQHHPKQKGGHYAVRWCYRWAITCSPRSFARRQKSSDSAPAPLPGGMELIIRAPQHHPFEKKGGHVQKKSGAVRWCYKEKLSWPIRLA